MDPSTVLRRPRSREASSEADGKWGGSDAPCRFDVAIILAGSPDNRAQQTWSEAQLIAPTGLCLRAHNGIDEPDVSGVSFSKRGRKYYCHPRNISGGSEVLRTIYTDPDPSSDPRPDVPRYPKMSMISFRIKWRGGAVGHQGWS